MEWLCKRRASGIDHRRSGTGPDGTELRTNEEVRRYVLEAAGIAVVPFQAFGSVEETGWFRLSVGAVGLPEIEAALPRLEAALAGLG